MSILITGANGLIGQYIGFYLQSLPKPFIATGKGNNRIPEFDQSYCSLDITNADAVQKALEQFKPTTVINCAAISQVDICESNHDLCDKVNVQGVINLVNSCNSIGAKLVHLSSDFVFEGTKQNYKEDDIPNPISYYGQSKLKGEEIIQNRSQNWALIRTILVYGIPVNEGRSNIFTWAYSNLNNNKSITVVNDQVRMPTYVEDLAKGIIDIIDCETGIYHLSGKETTTVFEFVVQMAKMLDFPLELIKPISSKNLNQKGKRPQSTGFDLTKAQNTIQYNPRSLLKGIKAAFHQIVKTGQ